ncbi:hypothetical protein [Neodiprion sertifer nucleopolyhedrovirus]|uniref:Uncharacterized protein n=1 Tax=Neodiprion sertifer nucleopolyhedrovirus TaxID=111874 RepID=Q6JK87_9CBAC|nr:hypothetical protein NeseNPV_gp73 [Neodiprion sertifer nucleopolyhedrovirus]AAQ96450.1 hypothetical protein [Neodiprion sertifer nucleopolyhedrovirus]
MVQIKKISSGADHFVLLSKCGRLYTMGNNEQNQLARPSRCLRYSNEMIPKYIRNNCIDAWATPYATFVKNKNDNRVYACGLNNHGQLGVYNIFNNPIFPICNIYVMFYQAQVQIHRPCQLYK